MKPSLLYGVRTEMVFSSASFLFFFLPLYLALDRILKGKGRNYWLILMSLVFYIWGETTGVLLLLALCIVNFGLGKLLSEECQNALKTNKLMALGGGNAIAQMCSYRWHFA